MISEVAGRSARKGRLFFRHHPSRTLGVVSDRQTYAQVPANKTQPDRHTHRYLQIKHNQTILVRETTASLDYSSQHKLSNQGLCMRVYYTYILLNAYMVKCVEG